MGRRLRLLTEDVEELKEELSELQVGDIFTFGEYKGRPIVWRILNKNSDTLFVISEYGLDAKPFDKNDEDYNMNEWNNCSLKKWLNSEFFNQAFDSEEKSLIANTSFGKIFCLSIEEVKKYFSSDSDRKCKPTQYAKSQGAHMNQGNVWWWLRSGGDNSIYAAYVGCDGDVYYYYVDYASGSVRPAMKLKI